MAQGMSAALPASRHSATLPDPPVISTPWLSVSTFNTASGASASPRLGLTVPLCNPLQASLWRAEGKNQGWLGGSIPPDPAKMASRIREKQSSMQRCAQLGPGARLKDNVHTMDSEAGSTVAVLLHPFRPLLTSVDGGGAVRVHNYRHSTVINRFHVSGVHHPPDHQHNYRSLEYANLSEQKENPP